MEVMVEVTAGVTGEVDLVAEDSVAATAEVMEEVGSEAVDLEVEMEVDSGEVGLAGEGLVVETAEVMAAEDLEAAESEAVMVGAKAGVDLEEVPKAGAKACLQPTR